MRHLKYTYTINLDKVDDATARLRFIIYYNNKRIAFSLGYRVEVDKWNVEMQKAMPRSTHTDKKTPAYEINNLIQRYKDETDRIFANYQALDKEPSVEQIRKDLLHAVGRGSSSSGVTTLIQLVDAYIAEKSVLNQWTMGTLKRHRVLRNKLLAYSPRAEVTDLDIKWSQGYFRKLIYTDKLSNNTAVDQYKRLTHVLKWGVDKGYALPKDCLSFKPNITETKKEIIFLEWDELMRLYYFDFPLEYQRNVRDCFCFQCFTSLRYSDLKGLKREFITDTHIVVTTQKTTDLLHIDLNDYSREILARHKDDGGAYALPVYSNQVYNRYLKEICALAGIDTKITVTDIKAGERVTSIYPKYALITSHAGRRTFICNALRLGIAPAIVMQWTGHSDYNSMRPYIGIMESAKSDAMKLMSKDNLEE